MPSVVGLGVWLWTWVLGVSLCRFGVGLLDLGFEVWGLRFWVFGIGFEGCGLWMFGFRFTLFSLFWITGFKFQILTSAYRGTISRVTGEPPGRSRGNHVEGSGGTSGPCDTYRYLFWTVRTRKASLVGEKTKPPSTILNDPPARVFVVCWRWLSARSYLV